MHSKIMSIPSVIFRVILGVGLGNKTFSFDDY